MLNEVTDLLTKVNENNKAMIIMLLGEILKLRGELEACRVQMARGSHEHREEPSFVQEELQWLKVEVNTLHTVGIMSGLVERSKVDVKANSYNGPRKARDIKNFFMA